MYISNVRQKSQNITYVLQQAFTVHTVKCDESFNKSTTPVMHMKSIVFAASAVRIDRVEHAVPTVFHYTLYLINVPFSTVHSNHGICDIR